MILKLVIGLEAKNELENIFAYIKLTSVKNAEFFRSDLLNSFKELISNPDRYPLDKFKNENDGAFRAYEHHS